MRTITILATKEVRDGLRNRWVAATILLLGTLALALSILGSAPTGEVRVTALQVSVVSLTSLSMYLVPLIALMLAFDALVGEFEHGTMLLLLTYPVSRWQIIAGKFFGHTAILLVAILVGYGSVLGILILAGDGDTTGWQAYTAMMASSLLLGCVFLAVGYLISALARERAVAIGAAVGAWLMLVVLYDLGLLSALMIDEGKYISEGLFTVLMLVNPADAYRLFNFSGFGEVGRLIGVTGTGTGFGSGMVAPLVAMGLWVVIPLMVTVARFHRREL
ncbi:MAG: ABC transporter permease [Gammaproteobacteria bacterium]|nr:MAG: ABC transporter permease [Gammaproteobacteria bacterium]